MPAQHPARRPPPNRARAAGAAGPDEPAVPADIDVSVLGPEVLGELRGLTAANADRVARHLVAAGRLLDEDPERALLHARAARRTAGRLAAVREAVGISAYLAGQWQEALTEFRAVRRMTGDITHLPVMVDCERGLGRPERAIELARSEDGRRLPPAARAELRIVEAGARRDLGEFDAALLVLQDAGLRPAQTQPWTLRIWYAYADTLLAAGREDQARSWFETVLAADEDGETDAERRLDELGS